MYNIKRMFKVRGKSKLLAKNAYILDKCVASESFRKVTHILVKRTSSYLIAQPGLYMWDIAGFISLEGEEDVKIVTTLKNLTRAKHLGHIELLTHEFTWKEIQEELDARKEEEEKNDC